MGDAVTVKLGFTCSRARCWRPKTKGRDDGLCYRCRGEKRTSERNMERRRARAEQPVRGRPASHEQQKCVRCARQTRADKLRAGVCGMCRYRARVEARHLEAIAESNAARASLCSVAGCTRPRELERTCIEHAPRFEHVRPARPLRAEDFAVRTRDPREGV